MNPILYESTETEFTGNGIGVLSDTISCKVTEERNGIFELVMQYPMNGIHYEDIRHSQILKVKLYARPNAQLFRIYSISKPINGVVTIDAEHVSYQLAYTIMPGGIRAESAQDALRLCMATARDRTIQNLFTTWSDVQTSGEFYTKVPISIRSAMGGTQGSILDVFGGEYEFDNYAIKLYKNRGTNRGVTIRYGKNLIDLTQEENIESTYTSVVAYWKTDEDSSISQTDRIDHELASNYPFKRTMALDFSSDFEEQPSVSDLESKAREYMNLHNFCIPKVRLKIKFAQLEQTEEYKNIAVLERVFLCDTVNVFFEKLGVSATAKVTKIVYDILKDKYDSVELGEAKPNMSTRVIEQEETNKTIVTGSALDRAIEHATKLITGELGGYVVMHENADGKPYEILIMDTDDINTAVNVWRWNQSGWGHSSTGYEGPYRLAATLDNGFVADFITSGRLVSLEIDNGNGTFHVDSSGNMTARNGHFTGDITGSTITGSTFLTARDSHGFYYGINLSYGFGLFSQDGTVNIGRIYADPTGNMILISNYNIYANSKLCTKTIVTQTDSNYPIGFPIQMGLFKNEGDSNEYAQFSLVPNANNLLQILGRNDTSYRYADVVQNSISLMGLGGPIGDCRDRYIRIHYNLMPHRYVQMTISNDDQANLDVSNQGGWAAVNAVAFNTVSSKHVKENIEDISEENAEKVLDLRPVEFDFKFGGHSFGFIAEEVEDVLPELVHTPTDYNEEEVINGDYTRVKRLNYEEFVPYLVKMIQMQQKEIDELREKLDAITRN